MISRKFFVFKWSVWFLFIWCYKNGMKNCDWQLIPTGDGAGRNLIPQLRLLITTVQILATLFKNCVQFIGWTFYLRQKMHHEVGIEDALFLSVYMLLWMSFKMIARLFSALIPYVESCVQIWLLCDRLLGSICYMIKCLKVNLSFSNLYSSFLIINQERYF